MHLLSVLHPGNNWTFGPSSEMPVQQLGIWKIYGCMFSHPDAEQSRSSSMAALKSGGLPSLDVHHCRATDPDATLNLLQDAIERALPDEPRSLIMRIVLECLVWDVGVQQLGLGSFKVPQVMRARLGLFVKRALEAAGAEAVQAFRLYGSKLGAVLDDMQDLVASQEVSPGTQVALLRADALLARLGTSSSSGWGSEQCGTGGSSRAGAESSDQAVPTLFGAGTSTACQPVLHPLLFELRPQYLDFHLASTTPNSARLAIRRALLADPSLASSGGRGASLAQAALLAVLAASPLERQSTGGPADFVLGAASVEVGQRALHEDVLPRCGAARGQVAAQLASPEFGGSLARVLASHSSCMRMVQVAHSPECGQMTLLRADMVLGKACVVRTAPVKVPALPKPPTPPAGDGTASSRGSRVQHGQLPARQAVTEGQEEASLDVPPGFGGSGRYNEHHAGQQKQPPAPRPAKVPGVAPHPSYQAPAPAPQQVQQALWPAPAASDEQPLQAQPRQLQGVQPLADKTPANIKPASGPVMLLRLLHSQSAAAGISAQLVGGFLALQSSKAVPETEGQADVLEDLLLGGHWAEAKAFMEAALQLAGLGAAQAK